MFRTDPNTQAKSSGLIDWRLLWAGTSSFSQCVCKAAEYVNGAVKIINNTTTWFFSVFGFSCFDGEVVVLITGVRQKRPVTEASHPVNNERAWRDFCDTPLISGKLSCLFSLG